MNENALAEQGTQAESGSDKQAKLGRTDTPGCLRSIEETSRRLAVSSFTTRRLIKSGHLRAVRVSKRVLVSESEIDRVISQGCGKHAARPAE
jgi:excisionase family DNA binding protein